MHYDSVLKAIHGKTFRVTRKLANNTVGMILPGGVLAIKLHGTVVVTLFRDGMVKLNSGGWRTATTKARINQFSPVSVYQTAGEWFAYVPNGQGGFEKQPFEDGMMVPDPRTQYASL